MRFTVILVLVALGLGETLALKQSTYLIKSREVKDFAEALTILRRFMSNKLSTEERCQKYASLLDSVTRSHLDQFKLAEIGLEPTETTRQKIRNIDVETLRQLYVDGVNSFKQGHIDAALLELVDCLEKYRTLDPEARRVLNNQDLKDILGQYKSIMGQPLSFLITPDAKHPDLAADQLKPSVRETVLELFNHNVNELNSRFPGTSPTIQVATPVAAEVVVPKEEKRVEPPVATVQAPVKPEPARAEEVFAGDELELLNRIFESLHEVYNSLPVESKLGDRCQAYGKTIQADPDQLGHQFAQGIVQEVAKKIANSGPANEVYKPDENVRENFLFILSSFPKEQVGHETWIDLVDCVSPWTDEDPKVAEFMTSPEQRRIFEELMRASEHGNVMHLPDVPPRMPSPAAPPMAQKALPPPQSRANYRG